MAHFVIAGKPDCPGFVHAIHVARYLEENLPNFDVNIHQMKTGIWEPWLEEHNHKYKWYHSRSPLIWKELSMRGGIPHYVGGLSEFWEYCYDYYGLESIMSPEDIQKLVADNMQVICYFVEMEKAEAEKLKNIRRIGISGAYHPILKLLLPELLQISELKKSSGMQVRLYDPQEDMQKSSDYIEELIDGVSEIATNGQIETVVLADTMEALLKDCEVLIILGDMMKSEEPEIDWLARHMLSMFMLADNLNAFASRNLKVILAINGPLCFCATVLIEACTTIRIQNIVAVTSDVGLGVLSFAAEQANVPVEKLSAPPVWGYIGYNEFVDVESTIICADIYRPYQRVIKTKGGSTLPLGIVQSELRYMAHLIKNSEDLRDKAEKAKNVIRSQLNRQPTYAKVRAIVSLLKLWFAEDQPEEIISLGICSNGSFGIPARIVFSQPAILNKNMWVPFTNFPLNEKSKKQIQVLIPPVLEINGRLNVGPNSTDSATYL